MVCITIFFILKKQFNPQALNFYVNVVFVNFSCEYKCKIVTEHVLILSILLFITFLICLISTENKQVSVKLILETPPQQAVVVPEAVCTVLHEH